MLYGQVDDDAALQLASMVLAQRLGQGAGYRFGAVRRFHFKKPMRFDSGWGVNEAP